MTRGKDELAVIVEQLEEAYTAANFVMVADIVEEKILECFFGTAPHRLQTILAQTVTQLRPNSSAVNWLHTFLSTADVSQIPTITGPNDSSKAPSERERKLQQMTVLFTHRLQGRPVTALDELQALASSHATFNPIFDTFAGWELFLSIQKGVTALLAGDFYLAEIYLTEVKGHAVVPALEFMRRNAHVALAVLQATLGDPDLAQEHLNKSKTVPRTSSWVETTLDAVEELTRISLSDADPISVIQRFDKINIQDLGEMWPFYVLVLQKIYWRAGKLHELEQRVRLLNEMPFPKVIGEGFTGSVFQVTLSSIAARKGDYSSAWEELNMADSSIPSTKAYIAFLAASTGRPQEALKIASPLRQQLIGLRQLELIRLSALSNAHSNLGNDKEALELLHMVSDSFAPLTISESRLFMHRVRVLAAKHIPGWSAADNYMNEHHDPPFATAQLCDLELAIIRQLAFGKSQSQIAQEMFLPLQTIHESVQSALNKLNADSVAAALIEAEKRGLL